MHEILNGLAARARVDQHDPGVQEILLRTPLALIPAGSSNGFATSLKLSDSFQGVRNIVEGKPRPIDLLKIEITDKATGALKETLWDFHTLSWAIGGEHDELQEIKLRWMATEFRNLIAPLIVIMQARTHKATLDIFPIPMSAEDRKSGFFSDHSTLAVSPVHSAARRIDDTFIMGAVYNSPAGAHDVLMSKTLKPDDGAIEVRILLYYLGDLLIFLRQIMIIRKASPYQLLRVFLGFEDASYLSDPVVEHYRVSEVLINPAAHEGKFFVSGEKCSHGVARIRNYHRHGSLVW